MKYSYHPLYTDPLNKNLIQMPNKYNNNFKAEHRSK